MDREEEAREVLQRDSWKVFRIISEFVDGFETMTHIGPSVSVFGSTRLREDSPYYQLAIELAQKLTRKGFAVITGGGPGIMEAANKGAQLAKGTSCGLSVTLPYEDRPNPYIDQKYNLGFRYFFVRKVMFVRYARGFVVMPGGLGTLDELFEALTLIQTRKTKPFPIYLVGTQYWAGLVDWLKNTVAERGMMSPEDLDLFRLTDDVDEVANGIQAHYQLEMPVENF